MKLFRVLPFAFVATACALLTGCTRGPAGLPPLSAAAGARSDRDTLARALEIRPNAAAEAPFFTMPTPDYYDSGYQPSVTFAKKGTLVEEHVAASGYLWYHVGYLGADTVTWDTSHQYDDGIQPSVTGDGNSRVFEVHRSGPGSDRLYYRTGTLQDGGKVQWATSSHYFDGYNPVVSFSGSKLVLEAHTNGSGLGTWDVATIEGTEIRWHSGEKFDDGYHPSIAANARGLTLEVERGSKAISGSYQLYYRVGHINAATADVAWDKRHEIFGLTKETEAFSSVSLDDSGRAIVLYACEYPSLYAGLTNAYGWCTLTGTLGSDNLVHWVGPRVFAPPMNYFVELHNLASPSVAMEDGVAVGVAEQHGKGLYDATTLLVDRSNWMGDRLTTSLKGKTLRDIVFPGSHDAGMYKGDLGFSGVAQSQNFYDQLKGGQRYFDIRPDVNLNAWHGPGEGYGAYVTGASIHSILADVERYMKEGHREVVILKFSHWGGFTPTDAAGSPYVKLRSMIQSALGTYLYDNGGQQRLADIPLSTLLPPGQGRGVVLPVMDLPGSFKTGTGAKGIYTYRDWDSQIQNGTEFTVYDQYSNTTSLSGMQDDQLNKLAKFDGTMEHVKTVPCDLFLLSWTLTPTAAIRASAAAADATLAPKMSIVGRNKYGRIPNVLFVDFYSWADPADVAIVANARF